MNSRSRPERRPTRGRLAALLGLGLLCCGASPEPSPREPAARIAGELNRMDWLVGEWVADFSIPNHGRVRPTMSWSWEGPAKDFVRHHGTQPGPDGGLVPEFESIIVWDAVQQSLVFLGVYLGDGGRVTEDGTIEILDDGSVRLHMNVHYPAGATLPFSDGAVADAHGHTLQFRRTFRRDGPSRLRDHFVLKRGGTWENPHPEMNFPEGYPWVRVSQ